MGYWPSALSLVQCLATGVEWSFKTSNKASGLILQQVPESQSTRGRQHVAVAIVVALSTAAAFGFEVFQGRHVGDEPVAMILCGCVLAALTAFLRMGHPIHLGLAAMSGFPILAVIDMSLHGGHNLLPLEFAAYAVYGVIGVVAATVVNALRS